MKTDFLVIGSGIAGLNFALRTVQYGKVIIVTKKKVMESNTNLAQGGIAAVVGKDDDFKMHIRDTLRAGCGLSNEKAVEILVEKGLKEIQGLISFGVRFDKENDEFHLTREGGHSKARVLHAGDTTGKEIEQALTKRIGENKDIEVLENCFAIDVIVKDAKCYGANVLQIKNKEIVNMFSPVTILATGGIGYVYQNTTNPKIATGDGIAMAFRAGATVEDMEFVQFHPTALNKFNAPCFLISEAFRGEGAVLVNDKGERFMKRYDVRGELAPRDIVSRAICKEGSVFLDMRHRSKSLIVNRFPMIYQECLKYGVDIAKDLIPVYPAAHYICGGIKTNEYGETNIQGLLAFGECACTEVHGANRLASNSLLESAVFSSLGAVNAKKHLKNKSEVLKPQKELRFCDVNRPVLENLEAELRRAMWNYAGIMRNEENLNRMLGSLGRLRKKIDDFNGIGINVRFLQLKNMATVSRLIAKAAQIRRESRGTHYRQDFPSVDDKDWLRHICLGRKGENLLVTFVQ